MKDLDQVERIKLNLAKNTDSFFEVFGRIKNYSYFCRITNIYIHIR